MRQREPGRLEKPPRFKRKSMWISLLCIARLATIPSSAQSKSADELEIRAAMVFNLTRFIDWPPAKIDPAHPDFVICILGSDPLAVNLASILEGKHVDSAPVVLRRINSIGAASACHIIYVGVSDRKGLAGAAAELARNNVLTVSEKSNAEDPMQVIGLPTIDEHVRIEVNLPAAQNSGLKISSKLLRLATVSH